MNFSLKLSYIDLIGYWLLSRFLSRYEIPFRHAPISNAAIIFNNPNKPNRDCEFIFQNFNWNQTTTARFSVGSIYYIVHQPNKWYI